MPLAAAERLRLAAARPDGGCPVVTGPEAVLGIARLAADTAPPVDASSCLLVVRVDSLDDAALEAASQRLTAAKGAAATILAIPASEDAERFAYAVKRLASVARSASPDGRIALDTPEKLEGDLGEQLSPYDDALVVRPDDPPRPDSEQRLWVVTGAGPGSPADAAIAALARFPRAELVAVESGDAPLDDAGLAALSRLQRYFTGDVSADPTATSVRRVDGSAATAVRYFDGKTFTPILLLPNDPNPSGKLAVELSGRALRPRLRREPHERRETRLPRQGRPLADARRVAGRSGRRPAPRLARRNRDADGGGRRRDAGAHGRRDHRAGARLGRGTAREGAVLHREGEHFTALPDRRALRFARPDDPRPLLLRARPAERLGLGGVP